MSIDMNVTSGAGRINLRVGAIIQKDGRILMVHNDNSPWGYTVGGRIHFGETAEEAMHREMLEELGMDLEIDRLGFIHENLFHSDEDQGTVTYEICYYYYIRVPEDFEIPRAVFEDEGNNNYLEWIDIDAERLYYPLFFRTELKDPVPFLRFISTDETRP